MIRIYEGVIYRETFEMSAFIRVIEKYCALSQKYKNENKNALMQKLGKLIMNSLSGLQIRKDINESD